MLCVSPIYLGTSHVTDPLCVMHTKLRDLLRSGVKCDSLSLLV